MYPLPLNQDGLEYVPYLGIKMGWSTTPESGWARMYPLPRNQDGLEYVPTTPDK